MATYRTGAPKRAEAAAGATEAGAGNALSEASDAGTGMSGPKHLHDYPGWCCPLGHFEPHEPPKT